MKRYARTMILLMIGIAAVGLWAGYGKQSALENTAESSEFPPSIKNLPQADFKLPPPLAGRLRGWILQGEAGEMLFYETDIEVSPPGHSHGEQWTFVVAGKIDITINGQTRTYQAGSDCFIPAGVVHRAKLYPGMRGVEYFAERDRYQPLSAGK